MHLMSANDYRYLCHHSDLLVCCEYLLLLVFTSEHARAFVQFRLALRDKKPAIVEEIDEEVKSETARQQEQLDDAQPTDGTFLLPAHN